MRLDPKLLKRLEAREDANEVLAEMLGVCPTCGQNMPDSRGEPRQNHGAPRRGEVREQIAEWRRQHPGNTNQSACARDVGCSIAYVGRIWHSIPDGNPPRGEADE